MSFLIFSENFPGLCPPVAIKIRLMPLKFNSLKTVQMIYPCKFGENQAIFLKDIVDTRPDSPMQTGTQVLTGSALQPDS